MRVFFFARNLIFAAGELRETDPKLLHLRFGDRALLGGGHGEVGARVLGTTQSPVCHPGQNCPRAIASSRGTVTMEGEQGLQGQRENVPLSSQKGREMRNKAGSSSVSNVQHKICFSCSPRVLLALLESPQKRDPDANSVLPNPGPFCQAVCQGNQPVTGGFWCSETPTGHQSGIHT